MEISSLSQSGNLLLTGSAAGIENWTVGRLLSALVSRANADGGYTLLAGGRQIQVRSESPLQPGTRMNLEVVETGPRTVLRRLADNAPPAVETRTLREALPRQGPATPLLSNLLHITNNRGTAPLPLPREVTQLAQQIEQALTSKEALKQPEILKQALKDSGLFLEARLAAMATGRPDPALTQDFKAGLLKLAQLLATHLPQADARRVQADTHRPATAPATNTTTTTESASGKPMAMPPPPMRQAPPATLPPVPASLASIEDPKQALHELSRQVDAALARVQISQINSVPGGDGNGQYWLLELPLRAGDQVDSFQLRIQTEDEPHPATDLTAGWSVMLSFNLEGLGPMYARLAMAGDRLSASLWAEQEQTVSLLEHYHGLLQQQFASAGLSATDVAVRAGRPAGFSEAAKTPGLIHETV